jgi:hypothetical protein
VTLDFKIKLLREQWKLCKLHGDLGMCAVIEKRALSLKRAEECKNDPELKEMLKSLIPD